MERYQPEYDIEAYYYDEWYDEAFGLSKEQCDALVKGIRIKNPTGKIRVTEHIIDNARYGLVKE